MGAGYFMDKATYVTMMRCLTMATPPSTEHPTMQMIGPYGEGTYRGKDMYAYKVGNVDSDAHVVVASGLHGWEDAGDILGLAAALEIMGSSIISDASLRELFDGSGDACLILIPAINRDRDGVDYSYERCNTHTGTFPNGCSAGVDLNKNFDHGWSDIVAECDAANGKWFKGTSVHSEPETDSLRTLLTSGILGSDHDVFIDVHYGGNGYGAGYEDRIEARSFYHGAGSKFDAWIAECDARCTAEGADHLLDAGSTVHEGRLVSYAWDNTSADIAALCEVGTYSDQGCYPHTSHKMKEFMWDGWAYKTYRAMLIASAKYALGQVSH